MTVMSEEWRVASDTQQRGESDRPPLDKGGLQGGVLQRVFRLHRASPSPPTPLPRWEEGSRCSSNGRANGRSTHFSPLATRHSSLGFVTRHLQILVLELLSKTTLAAEISVYPQTIQLQGPKATQVLLVNSGQRDITAECSFRVANPAVASVSETGVVTAAADGKTALTVVCKEGQSNVPISVAAAGETPRLSFVKDVVPVFTMAGCAGSNCHGSIRGQKGFKLSLFGYEPDIDYEAILPRIDRANPEKSLILSKADIRG